MRVRYRVIGDATDGLAPDLCTSREKGVGYDEGRTSGRLGSPDLPEFRIWRWRRFLTKRD